MSEFTTKAGAKVVINPASWGAAKELKKAMQKEIIGNKIEITGDAVQFMDILLKIDGSDCFEAALWPCLNRCLRNGEKIQQSTFDDVEARKDYYEIVTACVKENLAPLVESLFSQFSGIMKPQAPSADQK